MKWKNQDLRIITGVHLEQLDQDKKKRRVTCETIAGRCRDEGEKKFILILEGYQY